MSKHRYSEEMVNDESRATKTRTTRTHWFISGSVVISSRAADDCDRIPTVTIAAGYRVRRQLSPSP